MFDKDIKEFNATARVAAKRWHSDSGNASRQAVIAELAPLAAVATPSEIDLASLVLECVPGGDQYGPRVVPPKPSQLPGFAALGALTIEEAASVQHIFKPELLGYGRVLLGLAHILHGRITTREVAVQPTYDDWHTVMRPLLPFGHFVRLDGPTRSFLDDYCLVFALLCIFHVKQALTKQILAKRGTSTAVQRKQIVDEFMSFVETAPAVGWEPLYETYKAKWVDIVAATWWTYLDTDWLDVKWRRLLFVAERDAFARL